MAGEDSLVWIVGSGGLCGSALTRILEQSRRPCFGTGHETSILDTGLLLDVIRDLKPTHIVNCAGYTAVDKAEDDYELCVKLNADGPANLARLAADAGIKLIHLSTDYVFDGCKRSPYSESDLVRPLNAYGKAKALGETAIQEYCDSHYIVRTAWVYGSGRPNFVSRILAAIRGSRQVRIAGRQRGSPTWADNLAIAVMRMIDATGLPPGIYHYVDAGEATRFDIACEVLRLAKKYGLVDQACEITQDDEEAAAAKRPAYSVLSTGKLARALDMQVPDWKTSLESFIKERAIHA